MGRDGGGEERSPDQMYFQAIERVFIELRGSPLLLSPSDWRVAQGWRREGISLELIEAVLRELFAKREEQGKDKVSSLRYYRRAIEGAWKKRQALTVGEIEAPSALADRPAELDVEARLAALAAALPKTLANRASWQRRLRSLSGTPEEVEARLESLEAELSGDIEAGLDSAARLAFERSFEDSVEALAGRLPAAELKRASARLRQQLLRQDQDFPVLSLFAPEAGE